MRRHRPAGPVPPGGKLIPGAAALEAGVGLKPSAGMAHYVIKAEGGFTGFLQHLVNNRQSGVVTDMTCVCTLDSTTPPFAGSPLQTSLIFSPSQTGSQSFLRFISLVGGGAGARRRPAAV